jgi:hypothetical protein
MIDDRSLIFEPFLSPCINCKWFNYAEMNCKAFPKGIPVEILKGENQHQKPTKSQENDVVYNPID